MASVVKIYTADSGEVYDKPKWHYVHHNAGGTVAFCTGEYFGDGDTRCEFDVKEGKITCPDCIKIIKTIKAVKL